MEFARKEKVNTFMIEFMSDESVEAFINGEYVGEYNIHNAELAEPLKHLLDKLGDLPCN